jgi:hypothetical protein
VNDDDGDFGPNIRARAQELLDRGGLPEHPTEMRVAFQRLRARP